MFCYFKICKTASAVIWLLLYLKILYELNGIHTYNERIFFSLLYVEYWGKKDTISPNDDLYSWTGGGSLIFKWKGF